MAYERGQERKRREAERRRAQQVDAASKYMADKAYVVVVVVVVVVVIIVVFRCLALVLVLLLVLLLWIRRRAAVAVVVVWSCFGGRVHWASGVWCLAVAVVCLCRCSHTLACCTLASVHRSFNQKRENQEKFRATRDRQKATIAARDARNRYEAQARKKSVARSRKFVATQKVPP